LESILSLLKSTIDAENAQALALFLFFLPVSYFSYWAIKRGANITLRPIASYATLKKLLAQAAETGQPFHLSLGTFGVSDSAAADTMAGLTVLEYLADRAAVSATPPIVTMADATALPIAQDILRRAYQRHGYPEEYDPARARFIAPSPMLATNFTPSPILYGAGQNDAFPYAAGVMRLLTRSKLTANVMVGRFGDEFLLMSETGAQRNVNQIGGTSDPRVMPFVYTTVANPLIGEEIYAAGAYLSDKSSHISSLAAQDALRWVMVAAILIAMVLRTLGLI
jgi:uncharacterized protein DUF6754